MTKSKESLIQFAIYTNTFRARTPKGNAIKRGTLLKTNAKGLLVLAKSHKEAQFITIENRPKGSFYVIAGVIRPITGIAPTGVIP